MLWKQCWPFRSPKRDTFPDHTLRTADQSKLKSSCSSGPWYLSGWLCPMIGFCPIVLKQKSPEEFSGGILIWVIKKRNVPGSPFLPFHWPEEDYDMWRGQWNPLHPHQLPMMMLISPHPYQHLQFSAFFIITMLVSVKWYPMISFAFSWCLIMSSILQVILDICISSLKKKVHLDPLPIFKLCHLSLFFEF